MGCACVNNGEHNPDPYGGMLCSRDMTSARGIPDGYDACIGDCADIGKFDTDCKTLHWVFNKKVPGAPGGDPVAHFGANWTLL